MAIAASPRSRPGVVIALLCLSGLAVSLVQTLAVPLLPLFPRLLDTTPSTVSWFITSTLVAGAVSAPVLGRLGDMYGKRRMLLLSLTLVSIGSVLCAAAPGPTLMLVGRVLQGASFGVIALGISIMRDELPEGKVGGGIALMSSSLGIGAAVGLPLTGIVAQLVSWRWLFLGVGVIGFALVFGVRRVVPESSVRSGGRFDVVGAAGVTVGLVCLLLAISKGSEWGWHSPTVLGLVAAAVVIFPLWGRHQLRTDGPLVDLRVTARPAVLLTNLTTVLVGFAMFAAFVMTSQIMQAAPSSGYGFGLSLVGAGIAMLPLGGAMALLSPVSARLSAWRGPRTTLVLGGVLLLVGNLGTALRPSELAMLILATTISSIGCAMAYSALPLLVIQAVPQSETAAANSLNTLMRQLGTSMCTAVIAAITSAMAVHAGGTVVPPQVYTIVFAAAAGAALVATVMAALTPSPSNVEHEPLHDDALATAGLKAA
ncbi:MFS transporter [Pseudonocardia sp. N23]|uniref:MFS transporter n=1 Tax=Pseudonocardia sp. N23 TaxID=1987376 RepID=UPI000C037BBA|nr:MFS transporter [Pseudonocardia sp. N23]GAY08209.1 membrane transport protein [Pseudonocardia sp. N23]